MFKFSSTSTCNLNQMVNSQEKRLLLLGTLIPLPLISTDFQWS